MQYLHINAAQTTNGKRIPAAQLLEWQIWEMGCQSPPQTHRIASPGVRPKYLHLFLATLNIQRVWSLLDLIEAEFMLSVFMGIQVQSMKHLLQPFELNEADITPCHMHQGSATQSFALTLHKGTEVNQASREIASNCGKAKQPEKRKSCLRMSTGLTGCPVISHHTAMKQEASVPEKMFSQDLL